MNESKSVPLFLPIQDLVFRAECDCGAVMGGLVYEDRIVYNCPKCVQSRFVLVFVKKHDFEQGGGMPSPKESECHER